MTEQWLVDPNTDFSNHIRLQMLYNTFWQTTYGPRYLTGNLSSELDYFDNAPMDTFTTTALDSSLKRDTISFNSSLAHVMKFDGEVYHFHWTYGVLLFVTSAVLLAAGVASLALKTLTLAPDILGYASTSTRDNRFLQLDGSLSQPSYLDGLERARHLRDLQVMIGDVKPNAEVGQIAFTRMDGDSQRLRRGRGYM
ncbi:hypothetical protein SLS58_009075 [Diplodia intermedia]|uniref:Uncharacterized protein n=1 Tax=Diplodia intermedia TaxID=856260 RepID=A0ABR3TFH4_9PEZI